MSSVLALAAPSGEGSDAPGPGKRPFSEAWHFGGDFRLRQELFDHIPLKTGAEARGGKNDYFRFRSRLRGSYEPSDRFAFNVRVLHEFRHVLEPAHSHSWRWPDELVVDQLNVVLRSSGGNLQATIGRQDFLPEGEYRLFGEGTAKDGSRTVYMDVLTAELRDDLDRTRLTLFGAYDNAVNALATGSIDRDLNGYTSNATGMDEAGTGVLLRHAFAEGMYATGYWLWKHDTESRLPDGTSRPEEDFHTVGGRLDLALSPTISADGELAGQWSPSSDANRHAAMAALSFRSDWHDTPGQPQLSLNGLYLSGDDADTPGNEAWNPPWARGPWVSMLMLYTCDADGIGQWQNLGYVWLAGSITPRAGHRLRAAAGPLYAPESDGQGGGHERGWLGSLRWDFPLPWIGSGTPRMLGHVFAESLLPGDYYGATRECAYFLRWELSVAF